MSEELFNEQIRDIIKKIRKEQSVTQKDLAEVLGMTQGFIGMLETGKARLTMYQFQHVLSRYGYKANFRDGGKVEVYKEL